MLSQIIRMLKENGDFVSGEEMSRELGITRAAVWKKINTLKNAGFKISASTRQGYRLLKSPEFSIDELKTLIKGKPGKEIIFLETAGSTNDIAMELAQNGALHGTVVIADRQTQGRGRLGRVWVSPPSVNIHMSIIIKIPVLSRDAAFLTIIAAVACATAVRKATGLSVKLKWPNDLTVSDKKLGGILTEVKADPDRVLFAITGIGINVNTNMNMFPRDVKALATSVKKQTRKKYSRTLIIAEIFKELQSWLDIFLRGERQALLNECRKLSSTLGRKVSVTIGREILEGTAEDIDDEGLLVLRLPAGGLRKISAGDLTFLR